MVKTTATSMASVTYTLARTSTTPNLWTARASIDGRAVHVVEITATRTTLGVLTALTIGNAGDVLCMRCSRGSKE
jgi:hypothetical protein